MIARLLFAFLLLAAGSGIATAGDGDVEKGLAIARARCGRCHATGLTDTSTHAQAPAFRTLADRYPVDALAEALAEGIMSGHPDMPQFVFEPAEIADFLAYLDDLNQRASGKP